MTSTLHRHHRCIQRLCHLSGDSETIGGVPVKAIGAEAFKYHQYLALLELPEGLEDIGDEAFYNCVTLGHVAFPSTLKTIGNNAFYNAYKGARWN